MLSSSCCSSCSARVAPCITQPAVTRPPSVAVRQLRCKPRGLAHLLREPLSYAARRMSRQRIGPRAMVNFEFTPALWLGIGMLGGGLVLYSVRVKRPDLSRDEDVVISSVSILVGGILIFQVSCGRLALLFPAMYPSCYQE